MQRTNHQRFTLHQCEHVASHPPLQPCLHMASHTITLSYQVRTATPTNSNEHLNSSSDLGRNSSTNSAQRILFNEATLGQNSSTNLAQQDLINEATHMGQERVEQILAI